MPRKENIDIDGIIAEQFPEAKEVTPEEQRERKKQSKNKKLEKARSIAMDNLLNSDPALVKQGLEIHKHHTHPFKMEQVSYDHKKFFECVMTVMHPMSETERAYNLFFHIRDYGLFQSKDIDNKGNEKLVSAIVLKVENKHGLTKLTCSIQPDDAYWLMSKAFSFNSNWVVSLIPSDLLNTTDTEKVKQMVD